MAFLNRKDILAADDIQIEEVEVPEWEGTIYVRGMSGTARDRFDESILIDGPKGQPQKASMIDARAKLAAATICDSDGNLLFSPKDIKALGEKSSAPLTRIFEVAQRLSGLSDADVEELTEELETNPPDGSTSG